MIRFEHVSKAYLGGRQALQGVTFHMQPGEMAFLTGHSGAGKSTLLKLICGIERPSAGKIWFSGHDITRLKNREVPFLRRQIGMIFQDHHLLMDRTVYDNVAIPLIIAGASGDDIRRRVSFLSQPIVGMFFRKIMLHFSRCHNAVTIFVYMCVYYILSPFLHFHLLFTERYKKVFHQSPIQKRTKLINPCHFQTGKLVHLHQWL